MKVPMQWIKQYTDVPVSAQAFQDAMIMHGTGVEGIEDQCEDVQNVVVGKILSVRKHENSDHMVICSVDVGESEPLQIVTGAPNVHEGDLVPVAKVGAVLPGGVKIKKGKLRGVDSYGMCCSGPEINEPEMMEAVVKELQAVTDAVLQIDTTDPEAMERALRHYNGKALVNSVNGTQKSQEAILPLIQKYGGAFIALTIGEDGIPETAEDRVAVAEQIAEAAASYGIPKKEIIVDPLAMTISSSPEGAMTTLSAIEQLKALGYGTSLGVSNISFGLPTRDRINAAFFAMALERGLDCAIMNPFSAPMMDTYYAYCALHGQDENCMRYIEYASAHPITTGAATPASAGATSVAPAGDSSASAETPLQRAVRTGLKSSASDLAKELLAQGAEPLSVINDHIVPALNAIGKAFEEKKAFLPQLLMSAEAATAAFEQVKAAIPAGDAAASASRPFIIATVQGDIHDIGKNIVRVLLESFGFLVYDLGRDVPPEVVVEKAKETGCRLVGLSALMTTTVPAMEETIRQLHEQLPEVRIVVGGAVLTQSYADMIHADKYCKDAMDTVRFAEEFYREA